MLEVLDCLFLLNKYDSSGSALKMLEDIKLSHWNQLDISTFYSHNICTTTYCLYIVWKFRVHTRKFNVAKNLFCWIFLHISHTFLNHGTVFFFNVYHYFEKLEFFNSYFEEALQPKYSPWLVKVLKWRHWIVSELYLEAWAYLLFLMCTFS